MALELHHDFTFNPDGSGRVHVRWTGPGGPGAPSCDDFARAELERAQGVDAWADVLCEQVDDRLVFSATAWFPDARALRFHCQGFHVSLLDYEVTTDADGSVRVATVAPDGDGPQAESIAPEALPLRLAEERQKIAGARSFVEGMFGELVCSAVLRLPAPLVGTPQGERIAADAVAVRYEGRRLVDAIDRLMSDDALLTRMLQIGGMQSPVAALELLGEMGPVTLQTGPGAGPAFDYAAEVEVAREQFASLAADLRAAVPTAAPDALLTNVRVVATKIVIEADGARDLCPQGAQHPGVTLTLAGDLQAPALELEQAGYDRCVLADGRDVTPADDWDRRCHFPKTTADGGTVYLDLELPGADARGIAELTGHVVASACEGSEAQDLGFAELTAGAEGTFAEARLLAIDQDEDTCRIEVHVRLARTRVLGLDLLVDGAATALEPAGYSCCNDESDLTYRFDGELPPRGRLVMRVASEIVRTRYGFSLRDVDWLGVPLPS